ncbi:autophagy- protein 2 [Kalmusia sp. IMI 367209]|nr:autophagy- protein 2 [Kalmusia sp. IMI 367209]
MAAMLSGLSSAIGKRLLLSGLRHIDILDKDPTEFVSVDVGKRTTLEVRDVGLHVKKLVALLHLKLPPEILLSTARASLFRITFVFELGVPHIIIEIDGIQICARLVEDVNTVSKSRGTERTPPRARSPSLRRRASSPPADNSSDVSSEDDEEHIPTVDDLANSFIREEPEEQIKELEQELESQSEYLQDSVSSSYDDDDESVAGLGTPLTLPKYLRNILNTALDRLQIVVKDIDIEVQDQFPPASPSVPGEEDPYVALNFHVDRVSVDSVTVEQPRVDVSTPAIAQDVSSKLGKRRLRVENICGRLISDAQTFVSSSRASMPSSPIDTRSEFSTSHKSQSEPSNSQITVESEPLVRSTEAPPSTSASVDQSAQEIECEPAPPPVSDPAPTSPLLQQQQHPLISSVHTTDEDRFADAASDDGLAASISSNSSIPRDLIASSILYDNERLLDYAMDNNLLDSQSESGQYMESSITHGAHNVWNLDGAGSSHEATQSYYETDLSTSNLPTVSMLGQQVESDHDARSPSSSRVSGQVHSVDNLENNRQSIANLGTSLTRTQSIPDSPLYQAPPEEDLTQSKVFTHDEAESMYMSALSGAPEDDRHVPGGWDSSSSASSQDTSSDISAPIPEEMIAGSILGPPPDADDGCETPRPSSPQSVFASPQQTRRTSTTALKDSDGSRAGSRKLVAKVFLTIDEIAVWFPLGLTEESSNDSTNESAVGESGFDFNPSGLVEDSIFQGMPGSFSNYAHSTSFRRKTSIEEAARRRPNFQASTAEKPIQASKKKLSAKVSVEVGSVLVHIDFSTGHIMAQMLNRAMTALAGETGQTREELTRPEEVAMQTRSPSSAELVVKDVCIAWRERLLTESLAEGSAFRIPLERSPVDAIVKITMSSLYGASHTAAAEVQTKLQIGKFALSSMDHDIITFQSPRPKSRRSVGNPAEQLKNDVEVVYEQKKDRRLTIVTRPVRILFDLQRIDEALGSFGGFSGVLELSASISSNSRGNSPVMSPSPSRTRGVHFRDTPPPPSPNTSIMPKIQMQFGEVSFTLKGRSCAVQLQTTSVKLAVRESNVRLKVSQVKFSGPYTDITGTGAPLIVEVQESTVNFLSSPEEVDLDNLLSMITPTKDPFQNDEDILVDTLVRQRKKGSVLRVDVKSVNVWILDVEEMKTFGALGAEMAKLSKITKYLPDDDRPGILTLANIQDVAMRTTVNERLGDFSIKLNDTSVAHIGIPPLFAAKIGTISAKREEEILIHEVVSLAEMDQLPMLMMRVIGDEMEPVVKAKLFNACVEYHVSTLMAALGLSEDGTVDEIALGLASSIATVTGATPPQTLSRQDSASSSPATNTSKPMHLDVLFRNCALGLNPRKIPAKGLFVLSDAHFVGKQSSKFDYLVELELRKASIQAIDDIVRLEEKQESYTSPSKAVATNAQLRELMALGYITLSSIAAAKVAVNITGDGKDQPQKVDVEFKNDLFVLESCADSTQTLIAILNGLQPPMPPSTAERYRTTVPLQEMMESFTMDAIEDPDRIPVDDDDDAITVDEDEDFMETADLVLDEVPTNMEFVGSFYNQGSLPTEEEMGDSLLGEDDLGALATPPLTRKRGEPAMLESFQEKFEVAPGEEEFDFNENYFKDSDSEHKGKARKWDSRNNRYHPSNEFKALNAPLKVQIHDVNIIWNLYDGYDWPKTRGILAQAVEDVEARAEARRRKSQDDDEEDLDFIEAEVFNSVWIGVPTKEARGNLMNQVMKDINGGRDADDLISETGSYATTATRNTATTGRTRSGMSSKRLQKLGRGKHKRISFELKNVAVDLVVFEPGSGETVNSIDVRIQDLIVYDRVPGSTWNKFALCDVEPEKREMKRPMINLALLTVKPAPDLAATELVIKVSILPLRLHVDQFALEFIQRFFQFKDDSIVSSSAPSEQPFIQRLEVNAVRLKLDYKPRKVDYRSLRSGSTTELMNFLTLEKADILLRHAILYGIKSFDELHDTLNNVWMPDVRQNQLPQVLSGLAMVRPVVNVGSGVADLFVVPMREYKKDGRVVRSIRKGAVTFARNTTSGAAHLGAKVAIGAQTILEGAEKFLNPETASPGRSSAAYTHAHDWDGEDPSNSDTDEPRAVSNYANQPITVAAGLRSAAKHFQKDWSTARDAVIAIPGEIMEEGTGAGVAKVLARRAPTVVLRPVAGATKAISRTLMGVGNALDPESRRKIEDKYKTDYY